MAETDTAKALDPIVQEIKTGIAGLREDLTAQIVKRDVAIEESGRPGKDALKAIARLDTEMKEAQTDLAGRFEALDAKMGRGFEGGERRKTAGEQFATHPDYIAQKDQIARGGRLKLDIDRKALFNAPSTGDTPMNLWQARRLAPVDVPQRTDHIRDLMNVQQSDSASIEYVRQTSGAWVAEVQNPALDDGNARVKKEQELAFTDEVATAATIAHWIPVTKQALQDASFLRGWIDTRLAQGLRIAEDLQVLYGSGLNGQLTGLMVDTAVQEYDQADGPVTDTPADALRRAMTRLQVEYYAPNGIVLHPYAWEEIELTKDAEERYIWFQGPAGLDGQPTIWRTRVAVTPAIEPTDYLLGDFGLGATLWDYESPTITAGFINDDFVRNRLALLGEMRVLFTRQLPRAFVRGTLDVTVAS